MSAEDRKELTEKIEIEAESKKKNLEEIDRLKKAIEDSKYALELDEEGDRIKLAGLKMIKPTYEFEQSAAWEEWNRKSIELQMSRRKKQFEQANKQIEEQIKSLTEQNERIDERRKEITEALGEDKGNDSSYIG